MEKINFEAGTQVSPAKVTIDNVDHEVTPAVWEGNTPLSPFVLNKMQSNIENAISESGVIVSATEPTGANREKIWVQKSENMCNPNNKYTGAIATAVVGNMITYGTSEKTYTLKKCCKVQKGKAYAISWKPNTINTIGSRIIAVVNDNDITQYSTSYTNDSNSFIFTPTASGYLSISLDANATEVQVEGENATTYKPYVEPRIYVLNNNIYEELMQKEKIEKVTQNLTLNTTYANGGTVNYIKSNNIVQAYIRLDLKAVSTAASYINIASGLLFKPLTELKIYANLLSNNEAILSNNILVQIRTDGAIYLKTTASYANNSLVMITFTYITGD